MLCPGKLKDGIELAKVIYYSSVDIGTNKICSILVRIGPEGELKVLGTGITPSQGVHKGVVENAVEAREAITASLTEAQRYVGSDVVRGVFATISGSHINSVNTRADLGEGAQPGGLSAMTLRNLIEAEFPGFDRSQQMLHVIPYGYDVDGLSGVRDPSALKAEEFQLETHVVLGEDKAVQNTVKAIRNGKVNVNSLVTQSIASAEATLTGDERQMGVILVDIGAGTTDVSIYLHGQPWYTSVLPVGGIQMTRDLAVGLRVPYYIADDIKIKWGHVFPEMVGADEEVVVPGFQGQPPRLVRRRGVCEPLTQRMLEVIKLVMLRVNQAGLRRLPIGGIVLTGGGAEVEGLKEMVDKVLGGPVRIATPDLVPGLPSQLRKPAYSAAVGALLWGIKHGSERRRYDDRGKSSTEGPRSLFRRFSKPREEAVG